MKKRRDFIRKLGGAGALLGLGFSGRTSGGPVPEGSTHAPGESLPVVPGKFDGGFLHVVFFWLTDESEATRKKFLHELTTFTDGVEEINSRHIGTPADTDRDVIDHSWSYSLILSFDSKEQQDAYQAHPLHTRFIDNASHLWKKVLVYDSVLPG